MADNTLQSILPQEARQFESSGYWDNFFVERGGKAFEWYCETADLIPVFVEEKCPPSSIILTVGCGNSLLPLELADEHGFKVSVNVDFSLQCLEEMNQRNAQVHRPGVSFCAMDCLALGVRNESVDMAIDKGLVDAMFSDSSFKNRQRCCGLMQNVIKALAPGGLFFIVSLLQDHVQELLESSINEVLGRTCSSVKIYPLLPKKQNSPLRPFCLCIKKRLKFRADKEKPENSDDSRTPLTVELCEELLVEDGGDLSQGTVGGENEEQDKSRATQPSQGLASLRAPIAALRRRYARAVEERRRRARAAARPPRRGTLLTLDLKPWDADTDLKQVENSLPSVNCGEEGVTWIPDKFEILPVGYGVSKLRAQCLIPDSVDIMMLCESLGEELYDFIQSVDVVSSCQANIV